MWLFLAFLLVPLIEIALFIQVGGLIGLWPTLAIVVITAIVGTALVRSQGLRALGELQGSFSRLEDPTTPLAHGAMILLAGALLLTPGFFTDAVGFAFLVPRFRAAAYRAIRDRVKVQSFGTPGGMGQRPGPQRRGDPRGDVIDGDFHEIPEQPRQTKGPSGWTKD